MDVHIDKGDITAERVVIAAGYRANEVGAMLDIRYPVISIEHMSFVTEDIPNLGAREDRVPMVRCPRNTFYIRQERRDLLVGISEMEPIFDRLPCLQEGGSSSRKRPNRLC